MKTKLEIKDGRLVDQGKFEDFIESMSDGEYYLEFTNISRLATPEDYRKLYFTYRDIIWQVRQEYSKQELHDLIKNKLFPELEEREDNFLTIQKHRYPYTTKILSKLGWKNFIEAVKQFAQDEYNIYL